MYIRGAKGLANKRERIFKETAGNLDYIGEWHSHPRGASTMPSNDDRTVFKWIAKHTEADGRPPVMLICGDHEVRIFVGMLNEPLQEPICLP